MAPGRKSAPKRIKGLAPQVETHVQKIVQNPTSESVPHWRAEIRVWLQQIEKTLPNVGAKTAASWAARIAEWKDMLGD